MKEKRAMERMELPLKTEVMDARTGQTITRTAKIVNMSRSGFTLLTEEPLKYRTTYLFKFHVNMFQSITVEGRIVHSKRNDLFHRAGASVKPISMGDRLQFNRFLVDRIASLRRRFRFYAVGAGEILFLVGAMILGLPLTVATLVAIAGTLLLMVWVPF